MTREERRLRVVYVVPDLGVGGAERHAVELMSRLDRSRFAPSVVCIGQEGQLFSLLADAGVPAVAFGRTKRQAVISLLQLVRAFRGSRPDVVIVRGYNAELLGRVAAAVARVPRVVMWVHNCDDIEPRTSVRRLSDRVLDRVTDAYFGVAHRQVAYMRDELGYPEHKIRVILNGVEPTQFDGTGRGSRAELGLSDHQPVVGILAALRPEKDHETFLEAAVQVTADIPEARFLVVGDGDRKSELESLARRLGVADRVVFAGARHDVASVLRSMDVFVLSSFAVECFPMALLEAMASSLPAVCTSVGGVPEIVEEGVTGHLVPAKDPKALADRVSLLLRSPERRRQMGVAARERVERSFTISRSVQETERELLDVSAETAGHPPDRGDGRRHVLVLVENLSVPFDRRVWQESRALVGAGYAVTVICPMGAHDDREPEVVLDGVRILRYPLRAATGGPVGYLREYGVALWWTARLAIRVRRDGPVHVVHACNPPDLLFLVALLLRPGGTKFVFDHHDLVPELFLSRFPTGGRLLHSLTRGLERITFACADAVISTNESYREVAIARGGMDPDRVVVVRSGPDITHFVRRPPDPRLRRGKPYLAAYVGVMGPQDGVDYALRALRILRDDLGRHDLHCIFMGSGDAYEDMVDLSKALGIDDLVEFTGRVPDEFVQRCLSTADVCLSPDPLSPLNDVSTMNKVVEYMAMGRPLVSFDLKEARVSAGEAAAYAPANDEAAFAAAIDRLLHDADLRQEMGAAGRRRVETDLSWDSSRRALVHFYDRLFEGVDS